MNLISFDNFELKVTPEALFIGPIRKLYNKDNSKYKELFFKQLSVIFFMTDPRSSYSYIVDDKERFENIKEHEKLGDDFTISKDLEDAMTVYKQHCQTTSSLLLEASKVAIDKVIQFLKEFNLKEEVKGKLVYTTKSVQAAKSLASTIDDVPKLVDRLHNLQQRVEKEMFEKSRVRGGIETSILEDGFDLIDNVPVE